MQNTRFTRKVQSGFTIVELIVVIVILGILAAVAIPKFTDSSNDARTSVANATLGALKTAWSSAYAVKKGNPSLADVLAQMGDPKCAVTTSPKFTCDGIMQNTNTAEKVIFTINTTAPSTSTAATITSPSDIVIDTL